MQEYFYSSLDGMLVHRRVAPSIEFPASNYPKKTWIKHGNILNTVIVKKLLRPYKLCSYRLTISCPLWQECSQESSSNNYLFLRKSNNTFATCRVSQKDMITTSEIISMLPVLKKNVICLPTEHQEFTRTHLKCPYIPGSNWNWKC